MYVDQQSLKELHLLQGQAGDPAVVNRIDRTVTALGARKLRQRLNQPMSDPDMLRRAHAAYTSLARLEEPFPVNGADVIAVDDYLRSNLLTATDRRLLFGVVEAAWIELRYPELLDHARTGVLATRRLADQIDRLVRSFSQVDLTGDARRLVHSLAALADRIALGSLVADSTAWRVLRADHYLRVRYRQDLFRLLDLVGDLDVLYAQSRLVREGFSAPGVLADEPWRIEAESAWHPFLDRPVANDLRLSREENALILTGPNMAGKSTFIRTIATCLYLAQAGFPVPAERFRFHPVDALFTALSTADDLGRGVSSFRADLLRAREIADYVVAGRRALVVIDELFAGTNVYDAEDCLRDLIAGLVTRDTAAFVISTHAAQVAETVELLPNVRAYHFRAAVDDDAVAFDYALRPGVSSQRLGRILFRFEGLDEVLKRNNHRSETSTG